MGVKFIFRNKESKKREKCDEDLFVNKTGDVYQIYWDEDEEGNYGPVVNDEEELECIIKCTNKL